jgi:hypothetical protein
VTRGRDARRGMRRTSAKAGAGPPGVPPAPAPHSPPPLQPPAAPSAAGRMKGWRPKRRRHALRAHGLPMPRGAMAAGCAGVRRTLWAAGPAGRVEYSVGPLGAPPAGPPATAGEAGAVRVRAAVAQAVDAAVEVRCARAPVVGPLLPQQPHGAPWAQPPPRSLRRPSCLRRVWGGVSGARWAGAGGAGGGGVGGRRGAARGRRRALLSPSRRPAFGGGQDVGRAAARRPAGARGDGGGGEGVGAAQHTMSGGRVWARGSSMVPAELCRQRWPVASANAVQTASVSHWSLFYIATCESRWFSDEYLSESFSFGITANQQSLG